MRPESLLLQGWEQQLRRTRARGMGKAKPGNGMDLRLRPEIICGAMLPVAGKPGTENEPGRWRSWPPGSALELQGRPTSHADIRPGWPLFPVHIAAQRGK